MNYEQIKELIEVVSQSDLTTFEYEAEGIKLKFKKEKELLSAGIPTMQVQAPAPLISAAPQQAVEVPLQEKAVMAEKQDENLVVVSSPIVGTFYASASPESPAFVKVGDVVKKGQTLCIIEAMKLMNEIDAEIDGTIVEICVSNEQMVEYNQPLFKIKAL